MKLEKSGMSNVRKVCMIVQTEQMVITSKEKMKMKQMRPQFLQKKMHPDGMTYDDILTGALKTERTSLVSVTNGAPGSSHYDVMNHFSNRFIST